MVSSDWWNIEWYTKSGIEYLHSKDVTTKTHNPHGLILSRSSFSQHFTF